MIYENSYHCSSDLLITNLEVVEKEKRKTDQKFAASEKRKIEDKTKVECYLLILKLQAGNKSEASKIVGKLC